MKRKTYDSQSALASRLKVTQQRISELMRDPEWRWGPAPWTEAQAVEMKAWLLDRRAANNASAVDLEESGDESAIQALSRNPERVARIKLVIERTAKLKLERELLAGGYVKKEEAEKDRVSRIFSVRAKLQEIPLRSSLIAHKSDAECAAILTDWVREVCDYYANGGN